MPLVSATTAPAKDVYAKSFAVTRSMTGGTDKAFVIPKNSVLIGYFLGGTASNAGTTATLSIGTTSGTPVEHVNAVNVLAAGQGNGFQPLVGVTGIAGTKLTVDTTVFVKYAETGGASSAGNWTLTVMYEMVSSKGAGVLI
jgi:hypothetical protein